MRARSLKPSLFKNELLGTADVAFTILFQGLWCAADREGRIEDRPSRLHVEILPYRNPKLTVAGLNWLAANDFIVRYEVSGKKVIQVSKFTSHQRPHHMEEPSQLPPPPGELNRWNHSPITKDQRNRIMAAFEHRCAGCGSTEDLQIDHKVPITRGGDSADSNLQVLCGACNVSKRTQTDDEWRSSRDRLKIKSKSTRSRIVKQASPRSDSGLLTPSSLTPDSGLLTPDCLMVPSEPLSDAEPPDDVRTVHEHWCKVWNHPRSALDPKRAATIRRARKGYSVDDLCEAISGYRNSPHHIGQNERNTVYDGLHVLLRDADHIDAGLRFARDPPQLSSKLQQHNVAVLQEWRPQELRDADARLSEISGSDGEIECGIRKRALTGPH